MNLLDWLLVVLVLAYALSGYWQGFVTGAFATAGLLLGGLFGVWLAPIALGDANPSLLVSLGALFIVILAASLGQAVLPVHRRQDPRQDHLAADPRPRRRRRRRAQRGRRAARRLGARRRDLRLADRRDHARWCASRRCWPASTGAAGPGERGAPGVQRRRRHQLLPALPRAVRARADRRGRARAEAAAHATPTSRSRRPACSRSAGTNQCGRGVEGSGFLYADDRLMTNAHVVAGIDDPEVEIGDELGRGRGRLLQPRPRRRGAGRRHLGRARRSGFDRTAEARGRRRDPGLPAGRPVRRAARPDPVRAAAPLAEHLRRGHRHPRGVLAARPDPARQLRRPDRLLGRRRGRRRVRGVGHRPRDRLRADRRPGRAQRRRSASPATTRSSTGDCAS